ncbi:MAG: YfcE family phosphodiesterase [Desulfobacterales bacterium]|nr:YfcE family phosphodiesterase [Desulfobacterales bacterium]MDD4073820.1 YfcE family phosphodiesterase [Desulfobacterales bacterium]MDD4393170.1 YfcE family phosphodiesterase [Desulfobacterales bacterium]
MSRLLITGDIHGSYHTWQRFKEMIIPEDTIVITGDLFDTRCGRRQNFDFQPEQIRDEFAGLANPKYIVYGNCDEESFYPQQGYSCLFYFNGKTILLRHGHVKDSFSADIDVVIQGHTHVGRLEKTGGIIFLNPGSMAFPRDGVASYAQIDPDEICLIRYKTGAVQKRMKLA